MQNVNELLIIITIIINYECAYFFSLPPPSNISVTVKQNVIKQR